MPPLASPERAKFTKLIPYQKKLIKLKRTK